MSNILKQFDVLYIEGDMKAQENLIPVLESNFNDLYIASNGFEAVSIFDQYMDKIDLVIVDIDIETISGLDVANVIKRANSDIKVIVLSDVSNTEYFVEAIRINVDSFLLKPFDDMSLIDEATALLENRVKNIILQDTQDINKHYEKILDEIALVSKTDITGKITYVNKLFCDTSAYEETKLLGNTHRILRDPLTPKVIYQRLWKTISSGHSWNGKITNVSKCGLKYTSNAFIAPLFDSETKEINGYISVSFLIDEYELESKKMVTYIDKIQQEKKQLEKELLVMQKYITAAKKQTREIENEFDYLDAVTSTNQAYIEKLKSVSENITDEHGKFLKEHKSFMQKSKLQEQKLDKKVQDDEKMISSLKESITQKTSQFENLKIEAKDVLKLEQIIFRQKKEIDILQERVR